MLLLKLGPWGMIKEREMVLLFSPHFRCYSWWGGGRGFLELSSSSISHLKQVLQASFNLPPLQPSPGGLLHLFQAAPGLLVGGHDYRC